MLVKQLQIYLSVIVLIKAQQPKFHPKLYQYPYLQLQAQELTLSSTHYHLELFIIFVCLLDIKRSRIVH
jgi:hypothetical protein